MVMKKKVIALLLVATLVVSLYSAVNLAYSTNSILGQASEIIEQVQEIRGLTFKEKPKIVVITRAEAIRLFGPSSQNEEELRIQELTYKMTLLIPGNYSLIKAKREESAGWIALTVGNTIYIVEENFEGNPAMAKRALAHELTHVLQKQWFNARYGANTFDGTLAVRALVEGDADLVADIYCERNGIPIYKIRSLSGNPITDIGIFSYVFGDSFVRYLYEKGNWKLVNEAYKHYPVSTAQIMHPNLYLENVTPVNVSLKLSGNWSVLRDDRMGAFYVYLLLHDSAKLDNETAWNVSTAWRGDRLILAVNGTDYVLIWKVEFSSDEAAETFAGILKELAEKDDYAHFTITLSGKTVLLKAVRGVRVEA
ncbi:eCIS core domain-containing protein [Thermococcus sp.]